MNYFDYIDKCVETLFANESELEPEYLNRLCKTFTGRALLLYSEPIFQKIQYIANNIKRAYEFNDYDYKFIIVKRTKEECVIRFRNYASWENNDYLIGFQPNKSFVILKLDKEHSYKFWQEKRFDFVKPYSIHGMDYDEILHDTNTVFNAVYDDGKMCEYERNLLYYCNTINDITYIFDTIECLYDILISDD